MLETLMPVAWTCLAAYAMWYFTKAKHYAPITSIEAELLWAIHRKTTHCASKRWRRIERKHKIIGFECECGYRHIQRRPIVAGAPPASYNSEVSIFDKLHTSHKSG